MPDTLQPALTLEELQRMTLEDLKDMTLGEMIGDALDTRSGIQFRRGVVVTRGYTTTFSVPTR